MNKNRMSLAVNKLKDIDLLLVAVVLTLITIGLSCIYSAGHALGNYSFFNKQLVFSVIGMLLFAGISFTPSRVFYALAYLAFGIAVVLLIGVLIGGVAGFGAKRWLLLGGFRLQPSEPAKLGLILAISRLLSDWRGVAGWRLLGRVAMLGAPITLIVLIQPDLGTSTVFPVLVTAMLAWYGLPLKFFIILFLPIISVFMLLGPWLVGPVVLGGLAWLKKTGVNWIWVSGLALLCLISTLMAPVAWNQLEPYQKSRLTTFLDPSADPLGAGYQVIQSRVAIGSGGFSGLGYLEGTQTQLRFLPQQHTDFIFSLAGEEFGFVGTSSIILLYFLLVWRGFRAAALVKSQFMSLAALGSTVLILYHSVVNIGMALGDLPVTGLPLPFLSYGGSFLLTCICAASIAISASIYRREN